MYEFLIGIVDSIKADAAIINVNGIGYYVYMANPYRFSEKTNEEVKVWLHQVVSENDQRLYGFVSSEEKQLFLQLISVSGIGPRSAMSILSLDNHAGLVHAIESGDNAFLTKFPGVGKKTAGQMILDLKGKLSNLGATPSQVENPTAMINVVEDPLLDELEEALQSLGYNSRDVNRVLKGANFTDVSTTAEAIRIALRFMTAK